MPVPRPPRQLPNGLSHDKGMCMVRFCHSSLRTGCRPRTSMPGLSGRPNAWPHGQAVERCVASSNLPADEWNREVQRRALLGGLGMLACGCVLCSRPAASLAIPALHGTAPATTGGTAALSARRQWYDRYFAYAMATGMEAYEAAIAPTKQELFSQLPTRGMVLEVGIGTGPNLRWYSRASGPDLVVTGVDANVAMFDYARTAAAAAGFAEDQLRLVAGRAEALPFAGGSFDAAVITLVLCSVQSPSTTLQEVARVLRPGGRLVLIEHVISTQPGWLQLQQRVLEPLQRLAAGGCHLTRHVDDWQLSSLGLWGPTPEQGLRSFEVKGMGLIAPHVAGVLTRA